MRRKLLAVLSLVTILAMESVTVFATETTGTPSPNSGNVLTGDVLYGNAGTTTEVIETTTEQVTTVETTATAKIEIKETKTNADGSTTTTLGSGTKDANGVEKSFEVTKKTDGKIEVLSTNTGTTKTFEAVADSTGRGNVTIQSTTSREKATIAPTEGAKFVEFTNTKLNEVLTKASDFSENIMQTTGANVEAITTFDAQDVKFDNDGYATFAYSESYDGMPVVVLHEGNNGWERVESKAENGQIRVRSFTASPFIIMKLDKDVSGITTTETASGTNYAQPNASITNGESNTVSGATSPKTADEIPYTAMIVAISIACIAVCTKKIAKK
jgi:hypothetical protein